MDPCSIGKNLHQENDCHNTNFTNGKKGILAVTDLGKEQVELLKLRTELEDVDTLSICLHHKKMFLERYTKLQTVCCNPFGFHTGKLPRKSLRPLTIEAASKLSEKTKKNFKPGQKMCPSCAKVSKDFRANEEGEMSDADVEAGDKDLFAWGSQNIPGISFSFVSEEQIAHHTQPQQERFSSKNTIPGTRSHHAFVPQADGILMKRLSADTGGVVVWKRGTVTHPGSAQQTTYSLGSYIIAIYDRKWYLGVVADRNEEEGDVMVQFMVQGAQNSFQWPSRKDECWVAISNILAIAPTPSTLTGRLYKLPQSFYDSITHKYEQFIQTNYLS